MKHIIIFLLLSATALAEDTPAELIKKLSSDGWNDRRRAMLTLMTMEDCKTMKLVKQEMAKTTDDETRERCSKILDSWYSYACSHDIELPWPPIYCLPDRHKAEAKGFQEKARAHILSLLPAIEKPDEYELSWKYKMDQNATDLFLCDLLDRGWSPASVRALADEMAVIYYDGNYQVYGE